VRPLGKRRDLLGSSASPPAATVQRVHEQLTLELDPTVGDAGAGPI
jgi:hypothetical protein